jgi:branched-chain amino acid transport system permease protein
MVLMQVIVAGLLIGAVYALFSSGLTLVWGMMNVINFAHGEFVMLGMYVSFWAFTLLHFGVASFSLAAAVMLFILGVLVYICLIKRVMRGPMLDQILSTFGLVLVLRYSAFWAFGSSFVSLPEDILGPSLNVGGILLSAPKLVAGCVALVITIGMHLLLTRTMLGSQILAVAENRNAAMLMGIRPDRMQAIAWGLSGASAGIAGALIATFFPISATVGESLGLIAFVVVTFGGFGSVPGAMLAGLIIGLIESLSAFYFGPIYQDVFVYALFVLVLWVRPRGLMGKA